MSRSTWEEHRGPALSLTGGARSSRHGNGKLEAAQESAAGSAESYDDAAQPLKGMMADLVTTRIVGDRDWEQDHRQWGSSHRRTEEPRL